jgi:pimeloyl-ACP methyl ester carboxylesterase
MLGRILFGLLALIGLAALALVAGYFALKRPDIPYETLAAKYESAASRYVDLPGGVRMHYRDEGLEGAPTILLLHGFSSSLQTWSPWVERLGASYHLVSIDLPGHGLTRAPAGYQANIEKLRDAVHDFVRAEKLDSFVIAGNSMGGNVAWEYTLAYPHDVEALILVDAAGWKDTSAEQAQEPSMFKLLRNPLVGPLMTQLDNTQFLRTGLGYAFADKSLAADAMVRRYVDLSRAPGHRDILMQLLLGHKDINFATPERLAAISAPSLVLTGAQDELVPPAQAEQFRDAIAGARLVRFEGVGHMPQEEAPDASAAAVRSFLGQALSAPALAAGAP